jgi:hypothetical protein
MGKKKSSSIFLSGATFARACLRKFPQKFDLENFGQNGKNVLL